jgi:hypothetical protein
VANDLVESLLHPHQYDPASRGWQYFGCFNASLYLSTNATLQVTNTAVLMNATVCINLCIGKAMDFASVAGNQCYCSNSIPDIATSSKQCTTTCPGIPPGTVQYCGGVALLALKINAVSIYKRVVSLVKIPRPANPIDWTYNSCIYLDRLLMLTPGSYFSQTLTRGTDGIACTNICNSAGSTYNLTIVAGPTCYCAELGIHFYVWAGLGECSKSCANNAGESCGGTTEHGLGLGIAYVRRALAPSIDPPVPGTPVPPSVPGTPSWYNYGCYFGAVYLLDTILNGAQVSSLLDLPLDMSGAKCVARCKSRSYLFAITISGTCFCNNKPPGVRPEIGQL